MTDRSPTQRESHELAKVVFADPDLRKRFEAMVADTASREPVPDDFSWLPPEVQPTPEFSRFKALTQKLLGVPRAEVHRKH